MIWSRLKNFRCPKCNGDLVRKEEVHAFDCKKCDFKISDDKFNQIVQDMYKPKSERQYEDNLSELSNL